MFGRKKKKQEEPKSYLRCPYCGHAPMIVTGKCTYHNPRHTVYRYECDLRCLQGEVCQTAEAAFDSWVLLRRGKFYQTIPQGEEIMSLADVCWNISSVFIVITLGVIAILCVLMLLGVFVCIFDHDDNHRNDKSSKE